MNAHHLPNIINVPQSIDERGKISFFEYGKEIDFKVERIYYITEVPEGKERGFHAHKNLSQLAIAIAGSFDISLDDGKNKLGFTLNKPDIALYIPPGYYRILRNFSSNAVCLICASDIYKSSDYIYDYNEFLKWKNKNET